MRANYHTHTWRCNHATGVEEDYVKTAIQQEFDILGFSDHTPQFFPEGYRSGFRMGAEELAGYCSVVRDLQDRYSDKIRIHMGLEVEYYPALFSQLIPVLQDQGIEYLLLGQHFIGNEVNDHYSGRATADKDHLIRYCNQCIEAMQTGMFTYFAHPDLLNYVGDDAAFYREQMRRICREAKSCGIPLEINLLGVRENRFYPHEAFFRLCGEMGAEVCIGCDAHSADVACDTPSFLKAMEMADRWNLRVNHNPMLREVKF